MEGALAREIMMTKGDVKIFFCKGTSNHKSRQVGTNSHESSDWVVYRSRHELRSPSGMKQGQDQDQDQEAFSEEVTKRTKNSPEMPEKAGTYLPQKAQRDAKPH